MAYTISSINLLLRPQQFAVTNTYTLDKPKIYYTAVKIIGMKKDKTPHGDIPRGLEKVLSSRLRAGLFGRMFRHLPPLEMADQFLIDLGLSMIEPFIDADGKVIDPEGPEFPSNNPFVPAGYNYLGQFIDHDLTFDPLSVLQKQNDPHCITNFRTRRFDLDNLYGKGPNDNPFMYDGNKLVLGKVAEANEDDLPRSPNGRAIIGDPRNNENVIVSQIPQAFIRFHNKIVGQVNDFELAQDIVRRHYQWIVLYDYLPRIVGKEIVNRMLQRDEYAVLSGLGNNEEEVLSKAAVIKPDLKIYNYKSDPFMPVKFSVAAFRFGHCMVRNNYTQKSGEPPEVIDLPIFEPAEAHNPSANDLIGFRPRPKDREIKWRKFFKTTDSTEDDTQLSRSFDTQLVGALRGLPMNIAGDQTAQNHRGNLDVRNLLRGKAPGLPSGQAVARAMGILENMILKNITIGASYKDPVKLTEPEISNLTPQSTGLTQAKSDSLAKEVSNNTPLWYYILKEAELTCKGYKLGLVGGRIVAETFIGIMAADNLSFINLQPDWQTATGKFGCKATGKFEMADLLNFVKL